MLQPVRRRTWAPRGQSPIHYTWDRRDRISAISAVAVSPKRRRLGLYFAIHSQNIRTLQFERFAKALLPRFSKGMIMVLDRYRVHRAAARRLCAQYPRRISIERLPLYAPDLNPDEQAWNRAKYTDLANFIPEKIHHLNRALRRSLKRTRTQQALLRSFFKQAKLNL
ncbi:MAG: transposase [Nitrospira sp.]|nr:transposase [Planctomycetota bacterium]MCK6499544.1 transposase [Nitrospira sp.]